MSLRPSVLAAVFAVAMAPAAHAITFNFAPNGAATPLTLSSGGLTATFSSASGPGTFAVGSTAGLFSFPVGLGDFSSFSGDPLTITFSRAISLPFQAAFGIEDQAGLNGSDFLTVTGSNGQTQNFGTALNKLTLTEPEGSIYFTPSAAITSLTITSANPFALASASVPEPISLSLLGTGLLGLCFARRRA